MTYNARVELQPDGLLVVVLSSPEKVHVSVHPTLLRQIRERYPNYSMEDFQFHSHGVIAKMKLETKKKK